eukprot:726213-Pyramimonas_sp.AAC.1
MINQAGLRLCERWRPGHRDLIGDRRAPSAHAVPHACICAKAGLLVVNIKLLQSLGRGHAMKRGRVHSVTEQLKP